MTDETTHGLEAGGGEPAGRSTVLDDRTRRAVREDMEVVPPDAGPHVSEDMAAVPADAGPPVAVISADGAVYDVDLEAGTCTCPDHLNRAVACKHLRRARLAAAPSTGAVGVQSRARREGGA